VSEVRSCAWESREPFGMASPSATIPLVSWGLDGAVLSCESRCH
jgi:hypothetical protein